MPYMKSGTPFLYDDTTGDIIGLKDQDGSEKSLVTMTPTGLAIGGSEPTSAQRASVRNALWSNNGIVRIGRLDRAQAAIAAATPGSPVVSVHIGDSTRAGNGAGLGTQWTNSNKRHSIAQACALTSGAASADGFFCDSGLFSSPGMAVFDDRIAIGGSWGAAAKSMGGLLFRLIGGNASNAGDFRFTFPAGTAKVRIYHLNQFGTLTVQTNVGVLGVLPSTNSTFVDYVDFSVQAGSTYVELVGTHAQTIYVAGIYAISGNSRLLCLNTGFNGGKVADFDDVVNTYDAIPTLKRVAPVLTTINLTINDANAATSVAAYAADLSEIVEAALISGDVVLMYGFQSNTVQTTDGTLAGIRGAVRDIADAYNLTVMSVPAVVGGSWANANASSLVLDTWHLNYAGYSREAAGCMHPLLSSVL